MHVSGGRSHGRARLGFGRGPAVVLALLLGIGAALPNTARAAVSIGAWVQHSPDDISGFTTLTGDDNTASVTLPFTFTVEGTNYTTLVLSTNGWIEFGSNTSGSADFINTCLPTANHTNPFLAAYWDDLNPFGTIIRYGTVGTSPNRTWLADFEVDLVSGSEGSDDLRFQIQLHETSNLINVRFRNQQSATNAISATMGYQGAGGASATTVQPITCNGKVMDDNRSDEGFSVDVGRAGNVVLAALMEHSPDDISGFTQVTGNDTVVSVTMPFSVNLEGTNYNTFALSTNGWIEFGGNTAVNSDPSNACLPTSQHTNPLLAYYWDDMQTQGTALRHGVVGTSPNRTYIVDFQMDVVAQGSADVVNGQVQIHETSGLVNVKYRDAGNNNANGQAATIGFQGAGGASSAAYPLTCNGKIMDDNRPDEGWSVHRRPLGAMSLHAIMEFSPDDISGFTPLSGDNAIAGITLPFTVTIDNVNYTNATIGTNGLIQFGTTTGANPTTNTALPSASFTGPTVFWNWDDLATEGGNIRYGSVGTSPNRTFIVDFQENRVGDSGSKVNGQVQIHERSNVINVKYRSTLSVNSNGQNATIGFQSAGGASATPLTFNGKILDDNLPDSGWSIAPLPICGNSIVETKESCDQGGSNGATTSCCTSVCAFRASGQTCRSSAGVCDVAEICSGSSATCPTDAFLPTSAVCRSAAGLCDQAENCTGSANCPADVFLPTSTVCRSAAGVCDVAENCTGSANCPADVFLPTSTVCRSGAGVCDVAENCTGSANCPADAKVASGTTCRSAAGICDTAEACDGSNVNCPTDVFVSSTTVCRSAAGECDLAENCTGSAAACPGDVVKPNNTACTDDGNVCTTDLCNGSSVLCQHAAGNAGTTCRASAGVCDVAETCTGASATCPTDSKATSGTPCRASAGVCDVAEACDGSDDDCPADVFVSSSTVCRSAAGVCDVAENCTGSSANCPGDVKVASGTVCRSSAGVCDVAEACDGSDVDCPTDVFVSSSTVCRSSAGICDVAENCTGSAAACPGDVFVSSSTVCRSAAGVCDLAENCTGSAAACPSDAKVASGTTCRSAAGVCDVSEACDGSDVDCPTDVFVSSATVCRSAAGVCDAAENCTGSGAACPADAKVASGTVCRSSAGICDVAEACDGSDDDCPTDVFVSSATVCRSAAGVCDLAENCTGSVAACPADAKVASGSVCRSSAGVCDVAEACDGSTNNCPTDVFQSSATVCRSAAGVCDAAENCTGSGAACPSDAKVASGTTCRSAAGICDVSEACDGSDDDCPTDVFVSSATVCRSAAGVCDVAENCTGSAAACPGDAVEPSSTVCRSSAGICDVAENCTGSGVNCPGDAFAASSTVCRAGSGDLCDPDENCTGSGAACPSDVVTPSSTVCRSSAGICDVVENCTGIAGQGCPADSVAGAFVVCRSAAGECDAPDTCDGSNVTCPADLKQPANTACTPDSNVCTLDVCDGSGDTCTHPAGNAGTLCRAAAGVCDLAENCDGTNTACPTDIKAPSSTPCRASAGVCDTAENCTGSGDNCPADTFQPSSTVCRSSAGVCDTAENCTGSSANCPGNGFSPSSTVCRSAAGICDLAENCTGSGPACPTDVFKPSATVCRSAVGVCDIAENCTGSAAACPADVGSPDSDSDTVCDAIDDCPTVPDPGQADSDNDGDGDACDICTNTLPSFADRGKVIIGKLLTPPGDDTAKIKGRCLPFQDTPTVDPMTNGVRLVVQDKNDVTVADWTIPGGAYSTLTKAGWKVHTFPTGMTAQYKNAGTVVPLINGIKKLKFVMKSGQGITKFNAVGKNGAYPIASGDEPVKVTFIADPPIGETGQCCEMFFPGPAPTAPSCSFTGSGSTLRCK